MSALGKLIGVPCMLCLQAGHRCQAQLWAPVEIASGDDAAVEDVPMCLRCANNEPCCWQTARVAPLASSAPEGDVDPCAVPAPTAADRAAVAAMPAPVWDNHEFDAATRAEIVADLLHFNLSFVSRKWGIPRRRLYNLKYLERVKIGIRGRQHLTRPLPMSVALEPTE